MELLDVRHTVLLHLPLEDAPHVLNRVQVWRHTWPIHHLQLHQQVSVILTVCLGWLLCWKTAVQHSFWREGIIFCFRMSQCMLESMFPSINRSSPVPAVLMQPQTMMLPPPWLTVGKAQFSQGFNFFDLPLQGLFRVKPILENLGMTLATVL